MAAWRHRDARIGVEILFLSRELAGYELSGYSTAVQEGEGWGMRYTLTVDDRWVTRSAHVVAHSVSGVHEVRLERDGNSIWRVDGAEAPQLSGCIDVDLEASACTNAFPVNRLGLRVGEAADAPAAFVRAPSLRVERLDQTYERLPDRGLARYRYAAPAFDFQAVLVYDRAGLVVDYPGIAVRVA